MSHVLAAVLQAEPKWNTLPTTVTHALRRLLGRCLQKDRKHRMRDIGDVRLEIEEALATPTSDDVVNAVPSDPGWKSRSPWAIAVLASAVAAALAIALLRGSAPRAEYFKILPPSSVAEAVALEPAVAPDGASVVFSARSGAADKSTLWVQRFDSDQPQQLPSTENGHLPFWSQDSGSVAFFDGDHGKLNALTSSTAESWSSRTSRIHEVAPGVRTAPSCMRVRTALCTLLRTPAPDCRVRSQHWASTAWVTSIHLSLSHGRRFLYVKGFFLYLTVSNCGSDLSIPRRCTRSPVGSRAGAVPVGAT